MPARAGAAIAHVAKALREVIARAATPRRILFVGWLGFVVYAFPGFMSYDSVAHLSQARSLEPMTEWHPPIMALLWRFTDSLIAGPFPMLVLQSVAFLLGTYSLLGRAMSRTAAALVAVAFLVVPQNLIVMAVIWKDSQMAGYLMAAVAVMMSESRVRQVIGCMLVFLATGMRYNAAAATLPVVVLLFQWRVDVSGWRRYAIAAAVWAAITVLAFAANDRLVETRAYPWQTAAAPLDIVGTIRFAPELDDDLLRRETGGLAWLHPDHLQAQVRAWYKPSRSYLELIEGPAALIANPTTAADRDAITAAWKSLVAAHPGAFVRHRLAVFAAEIGLTSRVGAVWSGLINAPWGEDLLAHRASHSGVQAAWIRAMNWIVRTIVFRVWIYLVLAIAFLALCRRQLAAGVVLMSGILHELALVVVAPAVDYRYSQWMVACAMLGGILVFVSRIKQAPARRDRESESG